MATPSVTAPTTPVAAPVTTPTATPAMKDRFGSFNYGMYGSPLAQWGFDQITFKEGCSLTAPLYAVAGLVAAAVGGVFAILETPIEFVANMCIYAVNWMFGQVVDESAAAPAAAPVDAAIAEKEKAAKEAAAKAAQLSDLLNKAKTERSNATDQLDRVQQNAPKNFFGSVTPEGISQITTATDIKNSWVARVNDLTAAYETANKAVAKANLELEAAKKPAAPAPAQAQAPATPAPN